MQGFVTALTGENGITASTFWDSLTPLVPFIVTLVGVSFAYYILRRNIKGASKAKARI